MPYSSDIQIVNDANGTAHAFLADNGLLFACQWNAQAQRWDKGEVVPGSEGARGLQALVVNDLWPSGGASGAVPGNAQGIVLAYRIGNGASSQVVASFGAWGSDGKLSWTQALPLSSEQGDDEAFALVPAAAGTLKLVLQKREATASPQELLAQFSENPSELLSKQLDALASGTRKDSDLYVSDLQINSTGNGGYALQLSAPGASPNSQTKPLTPAKPTPTPATPAPAFGGNTQLSRAALAANAAPSPGLQSAGRLTAEPALLGAAAPAASPVTFAQGGATAGGGRGFGFTHYIKNPASLAGLALYPVRYSLGTAMGSEIKKQNKEYAPKDAEKYEWLTDSDASSISSGSSSSSSSQIFSSVGPNDSSATLGFEIIPELRSSYSYTKEATSISLEPLRGVRRYSEVITVARKAEKIEDLVRSAGLTGGSAEQAANLIYANPAQREFTLSGAYGGQLAGRGGYSVVNFSTFRYGNPALDSLQAGKVGAIGIQSLVLNGERDQSFAFGERYSPGWKLGQGLAGSFKTLFQYSSPVSVSGATTLIGFNAQQSLGWNLLAHKATYFDSGARFSLDLSLIAGFVMEQRYASAAGLSRPLADTGLAVGVLGNALSLLKIGLALKQFKDWRRNPKDFSPLTTNGLYIDNGGYEVGNKKSVRYAATAGGIASLGLAVGIPVGVGASQMNADGTYSFALGLQENVRARMLSKFGVGLEVIAGSQQNWLWTIGEGFANPSLQVLAFASVGAALPLGVFIPVIPNISWDYESNPPGTAAAAPMAAASGDLGGPAPMAASSGPPVSRGTYIVAPTGSAYPMGYVPASATDALLALPNGPIASLLDAPTTLDWHQLRSFSASQLNSGVLEWSHNNTFVGLNDGTYTNVPLIGLGLPGTSPATASFTASGGVISNLVVQGARSLSLPGWISDGILTLQAASDPGLQNGDAVTGSAVTALDRPGPLLISGLAVAYDPTSQLVSYRLNQSVNLGASSNLQPIALETTQGQYLALPEPKSGRYVFGLDVFQAQSGNPAPPALPTAGSVVDSMPLFSLQTATSSNGSPLSTANIQRIQTQLPISALSQGNTYPKADGSIPASNDYSVYSYSKVPIALLSNDGSGTPITPLNPGVTATVKLSAGSIVAVSLDQPLYFPLPTSAYAGLPYTLVVDVEQALGNPGLVNPTITVSAQQQALNNFTDQDSFSANASIANAGVFLSSGVSDQLPLLASYGRLPVQNRVSYVDGDTVVYLNNTGGSSASWQAVSSSQLTLEAIYNEPGNTHFTAASNPTAITDTASNTTYVFWVEASDPVIPLTGSDGEANYQAFMNALYGHQRINYSYATTSQAGTNTKWNHVNVNDLYAPADTLITDLRSFVVQVDGVQRSLLVWTEVPISALKSAEANPQELITSQLAVIKAGLINRAAASTPGGYTWDALFNDANGQSTIATIPWSGDRGSGLSIADLSAATLQLQVEPVARFSGTIYGTTLTVSPLSSGSLAIGDLILGAGVKAGTTVTAITTAATASSAGSYQVSTSQTVTSTNLEAVPLSGEAASSAGSFSGSGNTILTVASGASGLQVGDQLLGVGLEPGTFITAVLNFDAAGGAGSGAGSFAINRGPTSASTSAALLALPAGTPTPDSSQSLTTPVLSWSEAVRTPYNEAVLASAPLLYVPMAGLQSGVNSLNLGTTSGNTETFASSTGLNTSIAGALPKSSASAVENVQGLGVLATGLGSINSATLDVLRNTPQSPAIPAESPVAIFTGAINGTSLTISSVSQGTLAVGELLVGEGIPAGTTIAALPGSPNADQSGVYTLAYAPGADSSTVLASTTLRTLPVTGGLPLVSFAGSFSGAGGANGYTTLAITNLSGTLQVGDQVLGLGLPGGSTILQVVSLDLNSGTAQVIVSQGPQTAGGSYGLASGSGGSSSPYTIEFWTQLDPDSNPAGAGLVALGQPSGTAQPDRPVELPEGWLLSSSFGVEQLTWQDALNLSLETSLDGNKASDFYGWRWALVADGTNTTAMDGSGGNNLYRNALLLNNLLVGDTIEGVNNFLANYGLSSSDLTGFDGTPVDQIASSPTTQFQFSSTFSPNQALGGESVPTTSLNGVAIDTSTAEMNGGIVLAAQADANANLNAMFQNLWNFEQTYGQAKVNFSLNPLTQPAPSTPSTPPSANRIEQYGGYELQFVLQPGPAVSVNATGQIAFDVAPGVTLLSADGIDYRDNGWHYVAASFLPDYITYSASGTALELPRNVGTANLYIDGKLVASQADVINPYAASNFNDAAQLLSDNASGAIDLLAIYGQALSTSKPPAVATDWPMPTSTEALALLQETGFVVASKTPNPGQQPGAISNHWLAHTVDPNNAAKSTFTSALLPNAQGGLSWSEASTLNPEAAITPTTASASTLPLQNALHIPIAATAWGQQGWFSNAAPSTAEVFHPAGQTLKGITVTLTPVGGGDVVTRQLSPEEVLLGSSSLAALQPRAQDADFAYTFLSNQPALNLLITRQPSGSSDSNILDPKATYNASVSLQFEGGGSVSNTAANGSTGVALGFGTSLAATLKTDSIANSKALATAMVLEEAPLQLKYVDSGVQLSSQNSPSDPAPANSFGSSQVYGSFTNTGSSINSGWLAISQPRSSNAVSDPAGRVWINFAGEFTTSTDSQGNPVSSAVSDPAQAPTTWLNALAASNFSPNRPNLPLLHSALYQSSVGGLLIKADPSAGWGQNFGATMLVADVNNDGTADLVIAAPQANGGGAVVIIDGTWIAENLTSSTGQTILDLSNPSNLGSYVTVLRPGNANSATDITTAAGFGTAMAFQSGSSGTAGTLWIGAPNYLRTLDASNVEDSTQPIGALYSYSSSAYNGSWGSATPTTLTRPILGNGGTVAIPEAGNTISTNWWGAQLGTAVAISSSGDLAVSAPGVVGAMVYTGTEAITDAYNNFNLNAKPELSSGLLYRLSVGPKLDATQPVNSSKYTTISGLQADNLSSQQKNFLTTFQNQMVTQVVGATMQNNQAIQAAAIGAVMVFSSGTNVSTLGNTVLTASSVNALNGRTYYGANPLNTLGDSGFGSSVSFADLTNSNSDQLIVGATQSGGGGLVYMIDPTATYRDKSLGLNQYVAILAATNVVTAAEASDNLGSGLVNLRDVNKDGYDDILIQAFNAASSAGNGYLLFGGDQLQTSNADQGLIALSPSSIGTIQYADGSNSSLAILSELGSAGGLTGQGTYGPGDYNADGLNDIPLGSGPNAKGYLTWGHPYLESISDLQLSKLTSNNGFMLDGLATTTQGSLRSIGDFNGDGYGDFISINPGSILTTVRIELGGNTQEILAEAPYSYYTFTVANGTQVLSAGDINGDGMADIALFLAQNLSSSADGNQGAGSTTGILYGRSSADLPLGSGFGFMAPVDPTTSAPLTPPPGLLVEGSDGEKGLTDATPSVIAVGNTLYAAVKGANDNTLWFNQSRDGGSSWDDWSELSAGNSAFSTSTGPSLLNFDGRIYLSFVNGAGTLSLSSWDPGSNNPFAWSTPSELSTASGGTRAFSSSTGPQLVDRGDSIGVLWVEGGSVYASSSTRPATTPPTSPWAVVDGGASLGTPAVVRDGDTIYMAVQCGPNNSSNAIYWNSSSDGGSTWGEWQALPSTMTTTKPPSLAMVNGSLYLSYLGVGNNEINITSLNKAANSWNPVYQIPNASATYASLTTETVGGTPQLSVYYVSNDPSFRILKAYTTSPASSSGWISNIPIQYGNNIATQSSSGPLAVSQYSGQTYLAYQGGTTIIIATSSSSNVNNGAYWSAQALLDPGITTGVGLSSTDAGLLLSYGNATATSDLQLTQLAVVSGELNVFVGSTETLPLPAGLSNNITILTGESGDTTNLLLAGINTAANANSVQTSLIYSVQDDSSWTTPLQLQQLQGSDTTAIGATAAPSYAWLGSSAVLAVNEGGVINVYGALGGSSSLQLASTFTAPNGGPTIVSAPVLTTTDSGLVLTYTNSDGSISVNRLDLLSANGTPLPGVSITADGGIDVSQAAINWQSTLLTDANSGISSALASTPVVVEGTLLLANVRNTTTPNNQIWLNPIPNGSNPASTTWLNTTVQLGDGDGGWSISQQAGGNAPSSVSASWEGLGGQSPRPPALTEANGVLYAAIQGTDNRIYWNSSTNGGQSWAAAWQILPSGMTTNQAPALAVVNGTLYLAYLGNGNPQINITSLSGSNNWRNQYQIPNQGAKTISMITEGSSLALYYQGTNDNIYRTSTSTPTSSSGWQENSIQYNNGAATQTCSGQLVATLLNGTTYLAYQGGTSGSQSNTIYLTSSSSQSTASSWSLINDVPQPGTASHSGVGLTTLNDSLVLSYADQVNSQAVVALQQGVVNGGNWRGAPYALLQSVGATASPQASLFAPSGSSQVLVASINANSWPTQNITTTFTAAQPLSQLVSSSQTGSTLTPVGDLNNDGFADLLVTANNVAANFSSSRQLATGLRVISGAATSSQILANNDSTLSSQSVQLASPFSQGSQAPLSSITGADPASGNLNLGIGARNGSTVSAINATVSAADLTSASGSMAEASELLDGLNPSSASLEQSHGWGDAALNGKGSYGDLNGDGRADFFDPADNGAIASAQGGGFYSLWSIRAAGDVNGNGVDDVLLALSPNGPAYGQIVSGQPSALQSVLVDGSLFKVDQASNSFRLDQLKTPLNPYNVSQLYDVGSTTTSDHLPGLQNWFDPIQSFVPGSSLSAASTANAVNPGSAASYSPPNAVVSPEGQSYLFFSGADRSGTDNASGLWMAYQDGSGNWQQMAVPAGNNCNNTTPSAAFYEGKLYVAYTDINQDINIAICSGSPEETSNWSSYAVVTTASESTMYSPTLVAEVGRLGLYFPTNNAIGFNSLSTSYQFVRYLYSLDPSDASSNGNWGGSLDSSKGQYTGISGQLNYEVTSPIAATSFQGRTVLAFRSYETGGGYNTGNGEILLLTEVATAPTASDPTPKISWKEYNTGVSNVNGVGIATDQALLYLTTGQNFGANQPNPWIWSLSPNRLSSGTWTMGTQENLSGPSLNNNNPAYGSFSGGDDYYAATVVPYIANGMLMATWTDENKKVQVANLNATVGAPSQQSIAGYSIDGNIDINGDGFRDVLISDPSDPAKSIDNQYALFGGDYLNIASQVGTDGNDVIVGTSLADVIYTIQGADQVSSNGGADVIYTGAGNDQVSITDNAFTRIDAGSGFDVLALEGSVNQSYDFRLNVATPLYFAGTKLRDIELISSQDYGANILRFDAAAVNAINSDRILFLTPDAVDTIVLSSEFQRNSTFDTTYGGTLWNAYAAGFQTTPADSSPALVYLLNPKGASDSAWLSSNVIISSTLSAATLSSSSLSAESLQVDLPMPSEVINATEFGDGLILEGLRTTINSGIARFRIRRSDSRTSQVVTYCSSTQNANSKPGKDFLAVLGILRLAPGETSKTISVPLTKEAANSAMGKSTHSLMVQEIPDREQKTFDLLLQTDADAQGQHPVLSGLDFQLADDGSNASLRFRSDTTTTYNANTPQELRLMITRRAASDAAATPEDRSQTIRLQDGEQSPYDLDQRSNQQIQHQLDFGLLGLPYPSISIKSDDKNNVDDLPLYMLLNPEFRTNPGDPTLLVGDPGNASPAQLRLTATLDQAAERAFQIGCITLEDGETAAGLLADINTFKSRSHILFSSLQDNDRNVLPKDLTSFSQSFNLSNQKKLLFFNVKDVSLEDLGSLADPRFSLLKPNPPTKANQQVSFTSKEGLEFHLNVINDDQLLGDRIGAAQGVVPVLDLRSFSPGQSITGTLEQGREADFETSISFYWIEDVFGSVRDSSGKLVRPGEPGYDAIAKENIISPLAGLEVDNRSTNRRSFTLPGGKLAAPMALVDDGITTHTYFPFHAQNLDGKTHFRTLAENSFGFEDIFQGGDNDHNDRLISFKFTNCV